MHDGVKAPQVRMSPTTPETATESTSRLRCINCGSIRERADQDFRCPTCGDLFEVFYPGWQTARSSQAAGRRAEDLKHLWRDRKTSQAPADLSGVWRFRELLPTLKSEPITLREGNTPLYDLPRCARAAGMQ